MLGEEALKRVDVGAVGGHRDGDAPHAIGAQERMEIEIAGIVDDHRVAGLSRKRQTRSSACEQESVTTIWSGSAKHGALGEAHGEQAAQRRVAERLVILAPALGSSRAARRSARWTPRSSTQELGSQPAPGQRKSGAPIIACRLIQDGSIAGSGGGSALQSVSGRAAPATKKPEPRRATTAPSAASRS